VSRIHTPATGIVAGAGVLAQIQKTAARVPNTFATVGTHRPATLKAVLVVDAVLGTGSCSRNDQETIKLIVNEAPGCDNPVAADATPSPASFAHGLRHVARSAGPASMRSRGRYTDQALVQPHRRRGSGLSPALQRQAQTVLQSHAGRAYAVARAASRLSSMNTGGSHDRAY
jgi:hypothetical protein